MKPIKYQVFLSSTYSDLTEEREGIIKAILEMYHIPIGMEMFSAEDEDQWEIIRRTIEVSDYYILVLGLRYGSKTSDGISFTQKEYEYALDNKIPILAFVMNEMVPLPKDKRDDDLSEIIRFRDLVLKNSKMAQFWQTKDQLIKNVSISLMKQIMQKPGVGWVRGDKIGMEEALSNELTNLSKENRELRERIIEMESKISLKVPNIELCITPPVTDDCFYSYKKAEMPKTLNFDEIDAHLLEYISKEDINKYNDTLPSQNELDKYNDESEKIYKIKNYSSPLVIEISNRGSAKANNLFIDIEFPDELFVYKNNEEFSNPKSPIPLNPINGAQTKYNKMLKEIGQQKFPLLRPPYVPIGLGSQFDQSSVIARLNKLPNIGHINQHSWTKIDGNKITIKIDSLLHTRYMTFDDEYTIVPLKAGKHTIESRIICEEYENIETQIIEINV